MQLGVISDVHGNLPALEAVFDAMSSVDALVCAGDVVGYNPWPGECVDLLREHDVLTIRGNHDRAVVTGTADHFNGMAQAGVRYAERVLTEAQHEWLAALPVERTEFDGRVKLVHGHPDDPDRYTYPDVFSPSMLRGENLLVTGHTHVQGHRTFEEGVVLNPGSVGQPRDGDPRAAYAVVDLDSMAVTERRVSYDIDAVEKKVREVGLPEDIARRLRRGR
ncbi:MULTISPECIES: metallophosphoesterase [unclassified Haladaptatus]|uniref:metallophosphoesterase family protein n=1 Tax=unclassified Haladaptatus TaxID=2622732 RepID=UPI0023E8A005|nr:MULTISPECIES: metallophosphoesterase family protein [unclassified Haladaptatus]